MANAILVTGFGPFGSVRENPSAAIAARLDGAFCAAHRIVGAVLPVEIETLSEHLASLVERVRPAAVIQFGVAERRDRILLERAAVNHALFSIPDIRGVSWRDRSLEDHGPFERRSTLPLAAIAERWAEAGLSFAFSDDAGRYLCNVALYYGLRLAERFSPRPLWGFIHVPLPQEQDPASLVALEGMHEAARLAVEVTALHIPRTEIA